MNASQIKARTIVTNENSMARAETHGGPFLIPAAGGAALALAFHVAAVWLGAETGVRFLAALAGVSGWLYLGMGFRAQRLVAVAAGWVAAVALFSAALIAVQHTAASVGALFLIQTVVGIAAVALSRRSPSLVAWVSLNAVLGALTVI